jgi:hypothetical protein
LTTQTISVSTSFSDSNPASIRIEEVRRVQGEIHVLSRVFQAAGTYIEIAGTWQATDTVTITAPNLPIRYFQVGGSVPSDGTVGKVESISAFHRERVGGSSELLFSRVDGALSEWRSKIEDRIIERADELYGDSYGKDSKGFWNHWWNARPMNGVEFSLREADSGIGTVQVSTLTTNVQVAGVDEADLYETDGEYLYTISGNEVVVIRVATADSAANVVSRVQLEDTPIAMFLQGDRLTIISSRSTYRRWSPLWMFPIRQCLHLFRKRLSTGCISPREPLGIRSIWSSPTTLPRMCLGSVSFGTPARFCLTQN